MASLKQAAVLKHQSNTGEGVEEVSFAAGESVTILKEWQKAYLVKNASGQLFNAPKDLIENNASPWSGDHCSNHPDDVHGILFSNRKLRRDKPAMIDIVPTVLGALGVEIPAAMDGKPLF